MFSTQPNLSVPFFYKRQPGDTQGAEQYKIYAWSNKSDFLVENINFDVDSVSLSAVPLPAALPLFGSALLVLAGLAWRRGKVSQ